MTEPIIAVALTPAELQTIINGLEVLHDVEPDEDRLVEVEAVLGHMEQVKRALRERLG